MHEHDRTLLVDPQGAPIRPDSLEVGESYVFHYPYSVTPCFLLNLGGPVVEPQVLQTADGLEYAWDGGIGPDRSVVAFSAICAHRMTHPAPAVSFISYRHQEVSFRDSRKRPTRRSRVIYCCSEKSVYDPTQGARVLGGPADQPLAAVMLDYDEHRGTVHATATYGGEMFEKFFTTFRERLELEFATRNIRRPVTGTARVLRLEEYSKTQYTC